jgi:riboflavin kinase
MFSANLPDDSTEEMSAVAKRGVYYGYAQVLPPQDQEEEFEKDELVVLPMVMSMGYNPYYDNKKLTAVGDNSLRSLFRCSWSPQEIHIMHPFKRDFYGIEMRGIVLGYIRPELNYTSRGEYLSGGHFLPRNLFNKYRGADR